MSALPEASLRDSARVVIVGLLPPLVRGLFSPRRRAQKLLTALNADAKTVKTLADIRSRHPGQGARLLGGRLVVLWGEDAIREVLDQSAEVYASDSGAKGKGMAHFQPEALTLSRGEEWRDRRAFNESVLATKEDEHPDAARFREVVADEVERLRLESRLRWDDFERLFDHITLRVIFGDRARDDQKLTQALEKLMGQANRLVGLSSSDDFYEFYGLLERELRDPEPGSLVARFEEAPHSDRTRVVHQLPHWIFAMRDTLGANTFRALALIASDPDVERRVREDQSYLEGCLQEAMRLWPTVPLLARETMRDTELAGEQIEEGTQVMILNTFNHRDPDQVPGADRLQPERWQNGDGASYRFNHLSHGSQYCPGIPLVLLLGTAVISSLLERHELTLREPQLEPGEPLPHMLDFYEISFDVRARVA